MAATKQGTRRRVNDFLRGKLAHGDTRLGGVFVLEGPSPALRYLLLALVWTLIPIPLLRLWKFRYLVVTREAVLVVAISKVTLGPKRIVASVPREDVRIEERAGRGWSRLTLIDATGAGARPRIASRFHVSPPFRHDLRQFLEMYHSPPGDR